MSVELDDVLPGTEIYIQLLRVNELADVLPRTEFYNQLHCVNELLMFSPGQSSTTNSIV